MLDAFAFALSVLLVVWAGGILVNLARMQGLDVFVRTGSLVIAALILAGAYLASPLT